MNLLIFMCFWCVELICIFVFRVSVNCIKILRVLQVEFVSIYLFLLSSSGLQFCVFCVLSCFSFMCFVCVNIVCMSMDLGC